MRRCLICVSRMVCVLVVRMPDAGLHVMTATVDEVQFETILTTVNTG